MILIDLSNIQKEEREQLAKEERARLERNKRSDKGKERNKYDSTLPQKYKLYLMRANKKQLSFELTIKQFNEIVSKPCTYCGNSSNGVDRLDSLKGYSLDNSQPCCSMCNMMKYIHSQEVFLSHVAKIYEHNQHKNAI